MHGPPGPFGREPSKLIKKHIKQPRKTLNLNMVLPALVAGSLNK